MRYSPLRSKFLAALSVLVTTSLIGFWCHAETDSVLILHTNDLHDHMRPDYDGVGGLPWVSGYIQKVRAEREDTILLDGGDVMEKGDMFVYEAKSVPMYEAMSKIGYDAVCPGNHDDAFGLDHLRECVDLMPEVTMLCINLLHEDGSLRYPASKVFDVDGVRIGVIGMNRPRDTLSLDLEGSARAITKEAKRLEDEAHLIVLVCHVGPADCHTISKIAPQVDVLVGGHSHSQLQKPIVVKETGALIVQAGSYAEFVGELELEIDLVTEEIVRYDGRLVEMDHDTIPVDQEMLDWILAKEEEITPEADEPVTHLEEPIGYGDLGWLGAEALRWMGRADIGLCHAGQVIRARLPKGPVDVNAVFRTGGQRAYELLEVELSGADITAYVSGLANTDWGQTNWSGFRAEERRDNGMAKAYTDLEPGKTYRVIVSRKEWDTRFLRYFDRHSESVDTETLERVTALSPKPVPFTFTDAVVAYIRAVDDSNEGLAKRIRGLERAAATIEEY